MNQISIVIPTMWKFAPFINFLKDLLEHPLVGEVIIINNDIGSTPQSEVLKHPKVKLKVFLNNIIVNASWNFGVAIAENEKVCILNDDIIFDLRVFNRVSEFLEPGKFVVTVPESHLVASGGHIVQGHIRIEPYHRGVDMFHFGAMMFICKQDWIDIPAGLDMFYGDYWAFETMLTRFNQNYIVRDVFFWTEIETTSSTFSNKEEIYNKETQIYSAALELFNKNFSRKTIDNPIQQ
jgi:hypothetical protein